ncbi:hypothetical protein BKA62DRAFT_733630 [Auriculariales sp. MPI-PUGE-AT-0066]|nr:hypothetical protein BKA62DRAFT_733630 [Auriculariales sp. MPI-PUGE-AT-0066]
MVLTVPRKRAAVILGVWGPRDRSTPLGKWRRLRIVLGNCTAAHVAARCTQALHGPRVWEIARVLWRSIVFERCSDRRSPDRGQDIWLFLKCHLGMQWNRCVKWLVGTKLGPSANQVGRRRHVYDTEIKFSCGLGCDETITRDRWIQPRERQRSTLSGIRVFRIVVRH